MIEQYIATADESAPHTATLFADGSICGDDECGIFGAITWTWACPIGNVGSSTAYDGRNAAYQVADTSFDGAVDAMIAQADQDAAEGDGDGLVSTDDYYCPGFPVPQP
jgi:hypothetical protein